MNDARNIGLRLAILIFVLVALAHLIRLALLVEISIGDWMVPHWVSILGVAVPGLIAYLLWKGR